ncbi:MAG: gliding motility lipoprotein GldH [Bacteroidota bacterium]|jgi:gliding motility-associated lipoprotein GldH
MTKISLHIALFTSALAILSIFACQDSFIYKEKKSIPNNSWAYSDTLEYVISIADTSALYNLYAEFEHADSFPTQNLYLKLYTTFPGGKRIERVRSFDFFDNLGNPAGKCSGGRCTLRTLLQNSVYFNEKGTYKITLEQFTRTSPLPGISGVTLLLEDTGKKRQ